MTQKNDMPVMPEPLDNTQIHHPSHVRAHQRAVAAYADAFLQIQQEEQLAAQRKQQEQNRALTEDEQHQLALNRDAEQKAREKARADEIQKEKDAHAAYMASSPPVANVSSKTEFIFLQEVAQWAAKGYTVESGSIEHWVPGFYNVSLYAPNPVPATKAAKK